MLQPCVVKILKTCDDVKTPEFQTVGSSGVDLIAYLKQDIILKPHQRVLIPTGIKIELPNGFEAQIRPRSGLALKNGITVLNTPGTIDNDYRGEISVLLINFGLEDFAVSNGMRIAQMVFTKFYQPQIIAVTQLEQTTRGEGGFGSTGV